MTETWHNGRKTELVYSKYTKVFGISHFFDHEISLKKNSLVINLAKSVGLAG